MLLIKCSDADQSYKNMKNQINKGNINDLERVVTQLEQLNSNTYKDIQSEVQQGPNLLEKVGVLGQKINSQARDIQDYLERNNSLRSSSKGRGGDNPELLKRQINELNHKIKVLEKTSRAGNSEALEKEIDGLERDNDRLRREISSIQD